MVLTAAQGFFTGGPSCRLGQCDLVTVTKGDNNDLYIVLVIVSATKNLLSTICLYLIGFHLAHSKNILTQTGLLFLDSPDQHILVLRR